MRTLKQLLSRADRPAAPAPALATTRRPQLEPLDARRLMTVSLSGGVLTVEGTANADSMYAAWYVDPVTGGKSVRVSDGGAFQQFNVNASLTSVVFNGKNGADTIQAAVSSGGWANTTVAQVPVTMNGEAGGDSLYGSDGGDALFGGSSSDLLVGYGGNDYLDGGADADAMYGGDGKDTFEARNDLNANDYLDGGAGADSFYVNGYNSGSAIIYYDTFASGSPNLSEGDKVTVNG